VDLICNEDMSRGFTAAEARQAGICGEVKRVVTYFDMDCCESKCAMAARTVEAAHRASRRAINRTAGDRQDC
jgi:hypothetical protein